nr:hypothetical protein [Chloroflexota bacterium]
MQILIGIALLAVACGPSIPPPSAASPQPTTTGVATRPAPEDCEDFDIVPCPRQVARLSIPLAGSSFSLTYASDRA